MLNYIITTFNSSSKNTITTMNCSDLNKNIHSIQQSKNIKDIDNTFKIFFNLIDEAKFTLLKNILKIIHKDELLVEYLKNISNDNSNICYHFLLYEYNYWLNTWRKQYIDNSVEWRHMLDNFTMFNTKEYKDYLNSFQSLLCIADEKSLQISDFITRTTNPIFNMILACDTNFGIGMNNKIPWKCSDDQQMFKKITSNNIIICGRCTFENLPYLKHREIWCLTKNKNYVPKTRNNYIIFNNIDQILKYINKNNTHLYKDLFVAGGKQIYELFLDYISFIHLSIIPIQKECDTHIDISMFDNFVCIQQEEYNSFTYKYLKKHINNVENQYLQLCKNVIQNSNYRQTRNSNVYSVFNHSIQCDLRDGFPLLTTKKMFLRGIIEELLFFINGETDTTLLTDKSVNIWKGNTSSEFLKKNNLDYAEGVMGPMYGYQWRYFNKPYNIDELGKPTINTETTGIDQLSNVVNLIINDPTSRRILMTTFNPQQVNQGVLYPCHSIILQFYVDGIYLDLFCYNRSQDLFLGSPFNIASTALLLSIISNITNKIPRFLYITMGDIHIYDNHLNSVKQQLKNIKYKLPTLKIKKEINMNNIHELTKDDFILMNYNNNGIIKSEMIV